MRKVVAYLLYSLDGVVSDPREWAFDKFDSEAESRLAALIERQDAVLLGRVTYEEWAEYWPDSDIEPFASFINETPKYVASRTLKDVTWRNSTLLGDDVAGEVEEMKRRPGRDIGVHGSPTLARSLLRAGVVDELKLALFPVVAGSGERLFDGEGERLGMELADVERTGEGVLFLTYAPVDDARESARGGMTEHDR